MTHNVIISTEELQKNIGNPAWVIIDCRFELMDPTWGFIDYQLAHIPGAIYAHLDIDLSGPKTTSSGRHPLPESDKFANKIALWGIERNTQVVAYDTIGGAFASRLWFLLRLFGYPKIAVLDGGFNKWVREDCLTSEGIESSKKHSLELAEITINMEMLITSTEMVRIYQDPEFIVIDARSHERYLGEQELIDPVAGRIPGALNRFHGDNLKKDGTFKTPGELSLEFKSLLGNIPPDKAVVYCGSGVTSCHHLLAMQYAGLYGARLYLGSWSEWIRDPKRPIEKG